MPKRSLHTSLTFKLLMWFLENPGEHLSSSDIRVKFGSASTNIQGQFQPFVELGLLQRVSGGGCGRLVMWGAGPELCRKVLAGAAQLLDER
jgi:hypothetical protein